MPALPEHSLPGDSILLYAMLRAWPGMENGMFGKLLAMVITILLAAPHALAADFGELNAKAQASLKEGKNEEAAVVFTEMSDILLKSKEPDKARLLLNNAALAYIRAENYEAAGQAATKAIQIPGKAAPEILLASYYRLVLAQRGLGNNALAVQTMERMLKTFPKLPPADLSKLYASLGDACRGMELYGRAENYYDKAASFLPQTAEPKDRARLLTAKGLCQGNLGDFAKAAQSLEQAKKIAETSGIALTMAESDSNLGVLHWERGDYIKAIARLQSSLEIEKKNALRNNEGADLNNMGLVYKSMGRFKEAMDFFEQALAIARETGNKKDEGIALSNRALLNRIGGNLNDARADYRAAMALYKEAGFKEGQAGALMGIGKIAEREDRDLETALSNYREALNIYTALSLPRGQAEALLQIGGVLKKTALPGRASRDLVFDDEPTVPKMNKADALKECLAAYSSALALAEPMVLKEMIWSARQGIGFATALMGRLEEGFAEYVKAIDMVTSLRVSLANAELLGEFMAGKEDLYEEAMALCAQLYEKTKDYKYLNLQMRFSETLRNEVQKASAALVQLNFADTKKQALYNNLMQLGRRQGQAEAAIPAVPALPANAGENDKAAQKLKSEESAKQKAAVQKLDQDYQKLLAQWKKDYPDDAMIFESSARVDIPAVQKALKPDQVLIQYVALPDKLLIMAVSANKVDCVTADVGQKEFNNFFKRFLVSYTEKYGHMGSPTQEDEKRYYNMAITALGQMGKWLIAPVLEKMEGKKRVYFVADGFLAQIPFSALVIGKDKDEHPVFLVERFDISNIRPSFITALTKNVAKKSVKTLLAVANPNNKYIISLPELPGTKQELEKVGANVAENPQIRDSRLEREATESWFLEKLGQHSYEYLYFATHGVPYSEIYYTYKLKINAFRNSLKNKGHSDEEINREVELINRHLPTLSPLNGYLYLAAQDGTDESGLLTIKKITELDDKSFANTRCVILSACNTGVTFAPKTLKTKAQDSDSATEQAFNSAEMEKELRKAGWIPGVDQVSFVDIFMRRKVNNVYGTLWFVNDTSSSHLMSSFAALLKERKGEDVAGTYSEILRRYIAECKNGNKPLGNSYSQPLQPYLWAGGTIFGK